MKIFFDYAQNFIPLRVIIYCGEYFAAENAAEIMGMHSIYFILLSSGFKITYRFHKIISVTLRQLTFSAVLVSRYIQHFNYL